MNHRRLRLPAAMTLLALGAPLLAAGTVDSDHSTPAVSIQRDAREFRDTVRQNSVQFGHEVAHSFHQARHEFTIGMRHAGHTIRQWWDHARDDFARI